jgi:cytochrome c-type biogenesis protein
MFEISNIGVLTAFAAGIISFLSPCVLPLVPGYVSYIAGRSVADNSVGGAVAIRIPAVALSGCFVLGFTTVSVILGASATALGQMLLSYRYELNIVGGAVVAAFGLFLVGAMRPFWLQRDLRFNIALPGGRPVGAYVLGLAFAFGWTPCIGPILGAILTVSAGTATVAQGVTLLAIYSLGLGVPFPVAALFTHGLAKRLSGMRRTGRILQMAAGAVMILMGVAMITGRLSEFAYWLLETFPVLGNIG